MRCIFLDFDGVINNWFHFEGVALDNANVLKKIIKASGAKVIVTSSTKYELEHIPSKDYYNSRFFNTYVKPLNELGIEIFDLTPNIFGNRTLEIQDYIASHHVEEYVILDDELVAQSLQAHQVFPELYKGLQECHIIPALNILNGQLGFYPLNYNKDETAQELVKKINVYYQNKSN